MSDPPDPPGLPDPDDPKLLLDAAKRLHAAGRRAEAGALYKRAAVRDPNNPEIARLLGHVARDSGDERGARRLFAAAARLSPWDPLPVVDLAETLRRAGDLPEADRLTAQLAARFPDDAQVLAHRGAVLQDMGDVAAAEALYRRALDRDPDLAWVRRNRAYALLALDRPEDAADAARAAVAAMPDDIAAKVALGRAADALDRPAEAIVAFEAARAAAPDDVPATAGLARSLAAVGRVDDALDVLDAVAARRPDDPDIAVAKAAALHDADRFSEAEAVCRDVLERHPRRRDARANLANALQAQGRLDAARATYDAMIETAPAGDAAVVSARFNRAQVRLAAGDLLGGFRDYEARFATRRFRPIRRSYPQPAWDGTALDGRTLLVWPEQGLGDMIQFCRFVARVPRGTGGRIVVEAPPALVPVLSGLAGVDAIVPFGTPAPRFDVHLPVMSLAAALGPDGLPRPEDCPYLAAPPGRAAPAALPAADGRLRLGIVHAGSPTHRNDRNRSLPPEVPAPLLAREDVVWVSLHKGADGTDPLAGPAVPLGKSIADMGDTAAILATLDGVVAVDTAPAHLAGAMGIPTLLLLGLPTDWRWGLEGAASPWYPSLRLIRMARHGAWAPAIAQAGAAIDAGFFRTPLPHGRDGC